MSLWIKDMAKFTLLIVFSLLSFSCGGGSSGSGIDSGPASARISVTPSVIDTGDITIVEVILKDFIESSIVVKIRFPSGLRYVPESSVIVVDDIILDTGPEDIAETTDYGYLVYYLDEYMFYPRGYGTLKFVLAGIANVPDGKIGVDVDFDNLNIDNEEEFDPSNPLYDPLDETKIRVGPPPRQARIASLGGISG